MATLKTPTAAALALGLGLGFGGYAAAEAPGVADQSLRLLGQFALPSGVSLNGLRIGGISGLDRDPETGAYVALSDDRVEFGPARMFEIGLMLTEEGVDGVDLRRAIPLTDEAGAPYPDLGADPEALRVVRDGPEAGLLYWAHERDADGRPYAGVMDRAGKAVRAFILPEYYMPQVDAGGERVRGVQNNYGFESLAVDGEGRVILANEAALTQDGALATPAAGSLARVLVMDAARGEPQAEHVYPVDPVHARPTPPDSFVVSGLVELLYDPVDGGFFALERSFAVGQGHVGKLYKTEIGAATDVLGQPTLDATDGALVPMAKRLVATMASGQLTSDLMNIEALAYGPEIGGARTLLVVSDDNFGARASTQIFLFAIDE